MGQARDKFREAVTETLTQWRLGCRLHYGDWGPERAVINAGISEIIALRLTVAYFPLLQTLQRIENRANVLANLREDPYAPPGFAGPVRFRHGEYENR